MKFCKYPPKKLGQVSQHALSLSVHGHTLDLPGGALPGYSGGSGWNIIATSHGSLTAKGSFLEGKSPAISGKSRLVKYYSIWPDPLTFEEFVFTEALQFQKSFLTVAQGHMVNMLSYHPFYNRPWAHETIIRWCFFPCMPLVASKS